jgi:membrane protein implicated in regulation of membrane protease activity
MNKNSFIGKILSRGSYNMNLKTAKTFVWAAVSSILLGMVVMSPAGSLFLYSIAALCAVVPAIFGTKGLRIAGGVLLAVSLALLAVTYPKYDAEMTRYIESVYKRSSEGAKPAVPLQQERRQGEKR